MKSLIRNLFLAAFIGITLNLAAQKNVKPVKAVSPDGKVIITLTTGTHLSLDITYKGQVIMAPSEQALNIREFPGAFKNPVIKVITTTPYRDTIIPIVAEKRSLILNNYTETVVWFKDNTGIKLRAYDDGAAWRFSTRFPGNITIDNELVTLNMAVNDSVYFGEEDNFLSHSERLYPCKSVNEIKDKQMCVLPAVFRKGSGVIAAFTESDLLDYPGLYLGGKGSGSSSFSGILPQYPAQKGMSKDKRSVSVVTREDFIAKTNGTREFPWRVFGIASKDAQLIENDIVYRLATPCKLMEPGWIKPGKVAWDWWNDWNLSGVPFKAGINTETYKFYIDFAVKYGLEYVIFDEGWSANDDLDKINPDMDMDVLFAYAKQKNVKIILWVTGRALEDKFISSLDKFQKWGCAGIKMDFMIRDDQEMVNFYEKVAVETAKRHMLADFHGSYKPTGLALTYPNQLTREGVKGLENSKWSYDITPTHDCTIPFTRMFAGPMDYTPGAMINGTKTSFHPVNSEPMSQGTRCHELAKYIIFESPLQMLADAPTNYLKEPKTMDFLATVPVTWDATVGIDASISRFVTVARRHQDTWYLGSMTDWNSRDLQVPLSFLGDGQYKMEIWADGPNADRKGEDMQFIAKTVDNNTTVPFHLAPGGGYVARFTRL